MTLRSYRKKRRPGNRSMTPAEAARVVDARRYEARMKADGVGA